MSCVETASLEELRSIVWEKLNARIQYTYENSEFYRTMFEEEGLTPNDIENFEEYGELVPVTERRGGEYSIEPRLEEEYDDEDRFLYGTLTCTPEELFSRHFQTSGTTGTPMRVADSYRDYDWIADLCARALWSAGVRPDDDALEEDNFVTPTVVDNIDHDSQAVQEEIFGPVEEIFEWSDYDEMMEQANDVEYGLAAGVITNDISQAYEHRV